MTAPVYKIEVYHGLDLIHTIEHDAISIYTKEIVTDGVGHFQFSLPTLKGSNYKFNDIVEHDKVKIYLGYDSVDATPTFSGKIVDITGPLSVESGYIRLFSGYSLGEVLLRRLKKNKIWSDVDADDVVNDIATDLGLEGDGSKRATETNNVTIQVDSERYFDILRKVSDYWISSGVQLKYDFYVDVDNDLVWKARPLRTSGVDTFTVGSNITHYSVNRSLKALKNNITVYGEQGKVGVPGAEGRKEPTNGDAWTYDNLWIADLGSYISTDAAGIGGNKMGPNCIRMDEDESSPHEYLIRRDLKTQSPIYTFGNALYPTVNFWIWAGLMSVQVRLYSPDSSNYFKATLPYPGAGAWDWKSLQFGPNQEYDADKNPNGPWVKVGSPYWGEIKDLAFYASNNDYAHATYLDNFYFGHGRWRYNISDAASITAYEQRDVDFIFDKLTSDSQCESRAKALLYQQKDPPIELIVTVPGSTNIRVGDRVSMTIPAENITAQLYDIIAVEHSVLEERGFISKATMVKCIVIDGVSYGNIRSPTQLNLIDSVKKHERLLRELGQANRMIT